MKGAAQVEVERRLRSRELAREPLNADDWLEVYHLLIGFQNECEAIAKRARRRMKVLEGVSGTGDGQGGVEAGQ